MRFWNICTKQQKPPRATFGTDFDHYESGKKLPQYVLQQQHQLRQK